MAALLELERVEASYGSIKALHGVSLQVDTGQVVALLGSNGAGKTTTLRAISGTVRRAGAIRFAGHDISSRAAEDIAHLGVSHVPEGRGTLGRFTVEQNLRLGAYSRGRRQQAESMATVFGYFPTLAERRGQEAGTLSGGEQQMLAIGRALMGQPRLLLLDEPSLGLAPLVVEKIFEIIAAINRDHQTAVLLVEQNANLALEVAEHAYVLESGNVALEGSGRELSEDESIRRSYLGY